MRFLSRRGCTQGCPLGGFCFAAALQRALDKVHEAYPDVLVAALHDDAEIAGPPDRVLLALRMLIEQAAEVGLMPAGHKFTLYVPRLEVGAQAHVRALEQAIAGWTDAAALSAGRECKAHRCPRHSRRPHRHPGLPACVCPRQAC